MTGRAHPAARWQVFASFRGFRPDWLPRDLMAGLLLTAIAVPEQLATARLAGLAPETGLITEVGSEHEPDLKGREAYG